MLVPLTCGPSSGQPLVGGVRAVDSDLGEAMTRGFVCLRGCQGGPRRRHLSVARRHPWAGKSLPDPGGQCLAPPSASFITCCWCQPRCWQPWVHGGGYRMFSED
jgi:hypothetical protein